LALKYQVSTRTLKRRFKPFFEVSSSPLPVKSQGKVVILDGLHLNYQSVVLIARTRDKVITWSFVDKENSSSWQELLFCLTYPTALVTDGQRGALKAIAASFPGVTIQRCQFHVMHYCLLRLTKNPESKAGQELRQLVLYLPKVKSKKDALFWFNRYRLWNANYLAFVKEKTYQESLGLKKRRRWHYTHGKLHAAHSYLRRSLPYLFKYLTNPQIPNTTNHVEGGINAGIKDLLRKHRGLSLNHRKVLVGYFLRSRQ
jgi:hypothetical protein